MTSEITYLGDLRTECVHIESQTAILTDAPKDNQGQGAAFSPTDLVATALGSCMLTIMGILARRENIDLVGTKVAVQKIMENNPRRIGGIHITFRMPEGKTYSDKERRMLENAAKTCPVIYSIHPDIDKQIEFKWS